jgi:hypothetical protein
MTTPVSAPALSVTASSDQPSYKPGALITIDAAALQALAVAATISATVGDTTVTAEVDFSVEEPAAGASFGISDSTGGQISWSQQAGADPGTIVFTGTAPGAQPSAS